MAKIKKSSHSKKTLNILEKNTKHTQFDYTEVFRRIRTNIEFSNVDNDIKSIAITSTQPGEAKSTVALNLAFIFAAKYRRVLLIDGDLRSPSLHRYLKLSNASGLSDSLIDFSKTRKLNGDHFQQIQHSSFVGNLTILTAGMRVPNPSELLSSKAFSTYMQTLSNSFDFIIVDCAPAGLTSDAIPVGHTVDGTVFVVSAEDTSRKDALATINLLQRNNVNLLGSVLTKAETSDGAYYYY